MSDFQGWSLLPKVHNFTTRLVQELCFGVQYGEHVVKARPKTIQPQLRRHQRKYDVLRRSVLHSSHLSREPSNHLAALLWRLVANLPGANCHNHDVDYVCYEHLPEDEPVRSYSCVHAHD